MTERYLVGLTGGIASGKSLVGELFSELGATVIDSDRIVAEYYESSIRLRLELLLSFGPGIFSFPFRVDKQKLADRVFSDKDKLSKLEELVWPYVFQELEERISDSEGIVIIEGSRIYESGYDTYLNDVVTVQSLDGVQRYRLMTYRNMSREEANRIIELQRKDMISWPFTDHNIYNSTESCDSYHTNLRRQVGEVWDELLEQAELE